MAKVVVILRDDESAALRTLAERDRRYPRDLAALLIVDGLQRAGLLPSDAPQPATSPAQPQHPQAAVHVRR